MTKSGKADLLQYKFMQSFDQYKDEPVFLIYGSDSFLKQQTLVALQDSIVDKNARDFDYEIFFADETSPDQVIDHLEQYPFSAEFRTIVYKGIHTLSASNLDILAEYISDPNPTSKLLMTADKIDKRKKSNKQIMNDCISVVCNLPQSSKNLFGWLSKEMRAKNVKMDAAARNLFIESVELDYQIASNELEKLIIKTNGRSITLKDVQQTVGYSRTHNVFELQESVGKKNIAEVMNNIENLLQNKESEVFIIVMITNFFLQMWEIKAMQKKNYSDFEIKNKYMKKVFYNRKDEYLGYAKKIAYDDLMKIFAWLLETDTQLKTNGSVKKSIFLELLVLNICTI